LARRSRSPRSTHIRQELELGNRANVTILLTHARHAFALDGRLLITPSCATTS